MDAIAEFLRDPPTWVSVVLIVAGSLIGLYVFGRIQAARDAEGLTDPDGARALRLRSPH